MNAHTLAHLATLRYASRHPLTPAFIHLIHQVEIMSDDYFIVTGLPPQGNKSTKGFSI